MALCTVPPSERSTRVTSAHGSRACRRGRTFLTSWDSLSLIVLLMAACAANEGPPGPVGPPGADGEDGADGAANVIYSEWIPFDQTNWSEATMVFGFTQRQYEVAVPELDDAMIDEGLVAVYVRFGGTGSATMTLPYLGPVTQSVDQMLAYNIDVGILQLVLFNVTDRGSDPGVFGGSNSFRYVLVPGGVAATTALAGDPHLAESAWPAGQPFVTPAKVPGLVSGHPSDRQ